MVSHTFLRLNLKGAVNTLDQIQERHVILDQSSIMEDQDGQ